ncbi:MAG: hypothetical protein ACRD2J_10990 [Thermoanaerobaculia bacterium]
MSAPPRDGATAAALLRSADHRLLLAKRGGRDRMVAADDSSAIRRAS